MDRRIPPGARRIAPGIYAAEEGTMLLSLPELLEANGFPDTPENRDVLAAAAVRIAREAGIERVTVE
jgi:hypothetical protein